MASTTGHLFAPMPDTIRETSSTAYTLISRAHDMRNELFTDHYGFVVDYLAEIEMRKHNFTEIIDRTWARALIARPSETVSGLMKILFPARRCDCRQNLRKSLSWLLKVGDA